MRDKSSDTCIDGIELLISNLPSIQQRLHISCIETPGTFTSPIALPHLPYQGAIRLQNISILSPNQETIIKYTGEPIGENEIFPEDLGLPKPTRENTIADISDLVT